MTEAETLLWQHLRARQVAGCKIRRQVELGPYIADFACIEKKLIIEADGGQHGEEWDAERTASLESMGYRVLRFWNHEILTETEAVLERILNELHASPHPGPLPEVEGE
jgi:adenine-specific DNA-methyltransferase